MTAPCTDQSSGGRPTLTRKAVCRRHISLIRSLAADGNGSSVVPVHNTVEVILYLCMKHDGGL